MVNEEQIWNPTYYCPVCNKMMTVTFYDGENEPMDLVKAVCPEDHEYVLRISKGATNKKIVDQMEYIIVSKGGDVVYKDNSLW